MNKVKLDSFGLHRDPDLGVWWLVQDQPLSAVGLSASSCPFIPPERACPHRFELNHNPKFSAGFLDLAKDLMEYTIFKHICPFADVPMKNCLYIETDSLSDMASIKILQTMCAPTTQVVSPASMMRQNAKLIQSNLFNSALSRHFLTGVTKDNMEKVHDIVSMSMTGKGRLILAGQRLPPYAFQGVMTVVKPIPTWTAKIQKYASTDDFKNLGSMMMTRYMREERWQKL